MKIKLFVLSLFLLSGISSLFSADIKLAWDPNTESTLAGYKIYYGTASRAYGTTIDVGKVTTYTVTGLNSGTFYFAVTAYDTSKQESGYSNEVSAAVSSGPKISGVTASVISSTSASISWTTDIASDSQVEYGTSTGYGTSSAVNASMVTSHSATLNGLVAGTVYHYRVKSKDASGNLATSGDFTFTTLASGGGSGTGGTGGDTTAPAISTVSAGSITTSGAAISWTTNEASDSQVEYGTTTGYGSSTAVNASAVTAHSVPLSGLAAGTLYHYRVKSKDASGNLATSGDYTFTTVASGGGTGSDTTPPAISSVSAGSVTTSGTTISWTTNEASDSQVEYGTTTGYGSSTAVNTSRVTSHSVSLTGLAAGTLYHYRVKSKDASGNLAVSVDYTFTTAAPSTTSSTVKFNTVAVWWSSSTTAVASWYTNVPATTQVEYGTTTSYGKSTTVDTRLVTSHRRDLIGLTPNTLYHYRVKSKDSAGNLAVSSDYTFRTQP